jgi:hypothetical protein
MPGRRSAAVVRGLVAEKTGLRGINPAAFFVA